MPISNNLMFAVLSMNAYNRVQDDLNDPFAFKVDGGQIGNALVRTDALPIGYNSIGFHATAYDINGQIVISYRGTDFQAGFDEIQKDVLDGWFAGAA